MNILIVSIKGGVGKSSIAHNLAVYNQSTYMTNDFVTSHSVDALQIGHNKKRIPPEYLNSSNLVIDFGAIRLATSTLTRPSL